MRALIILFALLFPSSALAECQNPFPDILAKLTENDWRLVELTGGDRDNFLWHFNHDLPPVTDFAPDSIYLALHKDTTQLKAILVSDSCVLAAGNLEASEVAKMLSEPGEDL